MQPKSTEALPLPNWMPEVVPVPAEDAGTVEIDNPGPFEAGSFQSFALTYRAGRYGIDDSGSLKVCYRFASDQGRPQFDQPAAPNYVSVAASNNAVLDVRFDYKQNTRPWDRTIFIKVVRGFLKEGDTIVVRFGDRSGGSPGLRVQTFTEPFFALRVLVDPIATYTYVMVPHVTALPIVAGPRSAWTAVAPTFCALGETFWLGLRSDDKWGNPSGAGARSLRLRASGPLDGLPATVALAAGSASIRIEHLRPRAAGTMFVEAIDADSGTVLARSNPVVVGEPRRLKPYWADLHAQSGETIGTGSLEDYLRFARDLAFIDAVGHQGNDFQITQQFWGELNAAMARWNAPGRFVTVPGFEWSGNTALGGDRNVFYFSEDRPLRRSSHALVPDRSDRAMDCFDAKELFAALDGAKENAVVWAHCGGRYADIAYAHDRALERAVEVHSSWGTFEWLVDDAFRLGYRVGIVANSDGHKGRPGAEPPGASLFGALGGLTCFLLPELTRDALFAAMRARHHYATTGCRLHLDVSARLPAQSRRWGDDPRVPGAVSAPADAAIMGDIVATAAKQVRLDVDVIAPSPIVSIELRNGRAVAETIYPDADQELGRVVRVLWSGAEYRGRFRQVTWDGGLLVEGNTIVEARPINFFNPDRPLKRVSPNELAWQSVTTGNFAGVELLLAAADRGRLIVKTPHAVLEADIAVLGLVPRTIDCGKLNAKLAASRHADGPGQFACSVSRMVSIAPGRDNPIYVCVTMRDGHQAWSSPIYFIAAA
jgi:hypothetical protein